MEKLNQYLSSIYRQHPGRSPGRRALAAVLCLLLVFASISPAWALAVEVESEGEGGARPELPILEEGSEFEPGGEETPLEELPPLPGEEGEEEVAVEAEPPPLPEAPAPSPEAAEPEALPEAEPPAVKAAPSEPAPVYEAPSGPDYQTESAQAPSAPVENQALVDPQRSAPSTPRPHREAQVVQASPEAPPPAPPVEEPEPAATQSPAPSVDPNGGGGLKGHAVHTVAPGECLWSIATALLPPGATNAEIASEVARLWQLNKARIGTGNPNLILVGTKLGLR